MITAESIQSEYSNILKQLKTEFSNYTWAIEPLPTVELIDSYRVFGVAHSSGLIQINRSFIGTTAYKKLSNTLRHEFAHLAVGLEHGHGRVFKNVECIFGVDKYLEAPNECEQVLQNSRFKYEIIIHLVTGERVRGGFSNRKTKKYASYSPQTCPKMFYKKELISSFEYKIL